MLKYILDKIFWIKLLKHISYFYFFTKVSMSPIAYTIKNKILNAAYKTLPNMAFICLSHLMLPTVTTFKTITYLRLHRSKCYTSRKRLVIKYLFLCFIHRIQNTLYPFDFISYFLKFYIFPQDYNQVLPFTYSFSVYSV